MPRRNTRYRTRGDDYGGHELYYYITGKVLKRGTESKVRYYYKKYNKDYGKCI